MNQLMLEPDELIPVCGTPTNVRFCAPVRFDGVPLRIPKCTRALKIRH